MTEVAATLDELALLVVRNLPHVRCLGAECAGWRIDGTALPSLAPVALFAAPWSVDGAARCLFRSDSFIFAGWLTPCFSCHPTTPPPFEV
jgi:hypothetical protein